MTFFTKRCALSLFYLWNFNFAKPKQKSYIQHIWKYEQGDYVTLKHMANTFYCTSFKHEDIKYLLRKYNLKITGNKANVLNHETVSLPELPLFYGV